MLTRYDRYSIFDDNPYHLQPLRHSDDALSPIKFRYQDVVMIQHDSKLMRIQIMPPLIHMNIQQVRTALRTGIVIINARITA